MDKLEKALAKFTAKEREHIKSLLERLKSKDFKGLDIKKLKGRDDIFRIRKGGLRIIYRLESGQIFILAIERRREGTYNKF